jgi:hypothetical protein
MMVRSLIIELKLNLLALAKSSMQITVEIPDEIAQRLDQTWGSLSRRLLEVIIADAYHCGKVNTAEVRQILNLPSRLETHAFLKRMGVYLNYDEAELEQDFQTLKEFRAQ